MFKVGDKVRIKRNTCGHDFMLGSERTITYIREYSNDDNEYFSLEQSTRGSFFKKEDVELINSKGSIMSNLKEAFALTFKAEPEKSFRKAGLTNGDDFLTEDGRNIFESWLLKKYGADFKSEVVDGLLADMEKDCK